MAAYYDGWTLNKISCTHLLLNLSTLNSHWLNSRQSGAKFVNSVYIVTYTSLIRLHNKIAWYNFSLPCPLLPALPLSLLSLLPHFPPLHFQEATTGVAAHNLDEEHSWWPVFTVSWVIRLEIWHKSGLSGDWCLCTALHTRSVACYTFLTWSGMSMASCQFCSIAVLLTVSSWQAFHPTELKIKRINGHWTEFSAAFVILVTEWCSALVSAKTHLKLTWDDTGQWWCYIGLIHIKLH